MKYKTKLQMAALAVIECWKTPQWKNTEATSHVVARLQQALEMEVGEQEIYPVPNSPIGKWLVKDRDGTEFIVHRYDLAEMLSMEDGTNVFALGMAETYKNAAV